MCPTVNQLHISFIDCLRLGWIYSFLQATIVDQRAMLLPRLVNLPLHPERRCKLHMVMPLRSSVFPVSFLSVFSFFLLSVC